MSNITHLEDDHHHLKSKIENIVKESEVLKEHLQYVSFVDLLGKKPRYFDDNGEPSNTDAKEHLLKYKNA